LSADEAGTALLVFARLVATPAPPVVLIDGGSGSGKTTLAAGLVADWATQRPGEKVELIRLDDLYPGWDGLEAGSRHVVDRVLAPRADGRPAAWRRWDWTTGAPAGWHAVDSAAAVVIEGSGVLHRISRGLASLGVWVELDASTRKRRAISRDGDDYARHWDRWAAQEARFAAREHPEQVADLVVDGRSIAE